MTQQKIDDGGPAFPSYKLGQDGMSLRMWLAGKAVIPWDVITDALWRKSPDRKGLFTFDELLEYRAALRFIDADAMIAASKPKKDNSND